MIFQAAWLSQAAWPAASAWLARVGELDVVFPPPVADALAKVTRNPRVARFDFGHSIYFECPGAFGAAVEQFVEALPRGH